MEIMSRTSLVLLENQGLYKEDEINKYLHGEYLTVLSPALLAYGW